MTSTSRIGAPMTYDAAFAWLTGGESPAGLCSATRARKLLSFATDAGAVRMAVGRVLTFDGSVFEVFPDSPSDIAGTAPTCDDAPAAATWTHDLGGVTFSNDGRFDILEGPDGFMLRQNHGDTESPDWTEVDTYDTLADAQGAAEGNTP